MGEITVVMPLSPIPSHPSTAIVDETLDSIRHHLPDAEILLTFDGVRAEQEDHRGRYEQFISNCLWRADHHYRHMAPFIFDDHLHQTGMLRSVLDLIHTPLLLYVEQDTPLVTDEEIDFAAIGDFIAAGNSNLVRLHHESHIPAEHRHMIHGKDAEFLRTSQWSQRPHLASVAFYRRILTSHFSPNACAFIEDRMHGVVDNAYRRDGMLGWNQYRIHIYAPGQNLKRSYHIDGRAGDMKYDDRQTF